MAFRQVVQSRKRGTRSKLWRVKLGNRGQGARASRLLWMRSSSRGLEQWQHAVRMCSGSGSCESASATERNGLPFARLQWKSASGASSREERIEGHRDVVACGSIVSLGGCKGRSKCAGRVSQTDQLRMPSKRLSFIAVSQRPRISSVVLATMFSMTFCSFCLTASIPDLTPEPQNHSLRSARFSLFERHPPHFSNGVYKIARMDVGSANLTLNRNHVHPMPIVWPPLAEQKAIAAVLGALDDKIELNRRMNATLEGMAQALLQSWFVDFDPIRAKLDGRPPRHLPRALGRLTARQKAHRLGSHRVGERAGSIGNRRAAQGWSRRNHERRSKHRRGVR